MSVRRFLAAIALVSLIVFGGTYYLYRHATCADENYTMTCFLARSDGIIKHYGAKAAFPYVTDVILPRAGYATAHVVMHTIGEHAYFEEGEIFRTLAYLEPYEAYTSQEEFLGGFDGFVHGSVTAYYDDVSDGRSKSERMIYLCEGSEVKNITTNTRGCYHAIGHAVMYSSGNKIDDAVPICKSALTEEAQNGCYYGAFMENTFLFWTGYHPGIPRPDAMGTSSIPVCGRFTGAVASECHRFVGQTYLAIRLAETDDLSAEDMLDATKECDLLSDTDGRDLCLKRLAALFLPPYVSGSWSEEGVCRALFPAHHQKICLFALKDGLRRNFGVDRKRVKSPPFTRILTLLRAAFL